VNGIRSKRNAAVRVPLVKRFAGVQTASITSETARTRGDGNGLEFPLGKPKDLIDIGLTVKLIPRDGSG
jgi:hypothetical protein